MGDSPLRWMWRNSWTIWNTEMICRNNSTRKRLSSRRSSVRILFSSRMSSTKKKKPYNANSSKSQRTMHFWIPFGLPLQRQNPMSNQALKCRMNQLDHLNHRLLQLKMHSWKKHWLSSLKRCALWTLYMHKIWRSWLLNQSSLKMHRNSSPTSKCKLLSSR